VIKYQEVTKNNVSERQGDRDLSLLPRGRDRDTDMFAVLDGFDPDRERKTASGP
jgi:hypothetical protein